MDFQKLIRKRYSVRAYDSRPIEEEKMARILEAASLAPTAVNLQPLRVVIVQTKGREKELLRIYGRKWLVQPPRGGRRLRPSGRRQEAQTRRLERSRGRFGDRHGSSDPGRGRVLINIFIEWLRRTVKFEEVNLHSYETVGHAPQRPADYFIFYNTERLHSSLGYRTPREIYFSDLTCPHLLYHL